MGKAYFEIPIPLSCGGRDSPCAARPICPINAEIANNAMKSFENGQIPEEFTKSRHPKCPLDIRGDILVFVQECTKCEYVREDLVKIMFCQKCGTKLRDKGHKYIEKNLSNRLDENGEEQ